MKNINVLIGIKELKNQRNQIISLISGSDFFDLTNQRNQIIRLINGSDNE
jgi:hypothetical protein